MTISSYSPNRSWQLALVMLAVLSGLVASLGSPLPVLFVAALVMAIVLAASPVALLWLVVVGGLILAGVAELYLPKVHQARWGVVIISVGLGIIALVTWALRRNAGPLARREPWPAIGAWAAIFVAIALFSGIINLGATLDTVVGFKGYFQVWSILLAFALLPLRPASVERFMAFLVWLALLQLPFVLHQHFFLEPPRLRVAEAAKGVVAQDILVGTFSGSVTGGGAGTAMAVLLLIALVISIAHWRCGMISGMRLAAMSVISLVPLAIGELKISLVFIPLGLFLVFEDKVRRSPVKAMGLLAVSAFLVAPMFLIFTLLPRTDASHQQTAGKYWHQMLSYNLGDRGYGNVALNRTTVYPFWAKYQESGSGSIVNTLIGYGPGASKDATGSLTEHSLSRERFPGYGIGLTGLAGLLWDVGILGAIAALGFFVSAWRMARRLVRDAAPGTSRWVHLKGAEAGVAMMGLSLLHNNMFLYEIGFQTLLMLLVGYLTYVRRSYVIPQTTAVMPHHR